MRFAGGVDAPIVEAAEHCRPPLEHGRRKWKPDFAILFSVVLFCRGISCPWASYFVCIRRGLLGGPNSAALCGYGKEVTIVRIGLLRRPCSRCRSSPSVSVPHWRKRPIRFLPGTTARQRNPSPISSRA